MSIYKNLFVEEEVSYRDLFNEVKMNKRPSLFPEEVDDIPTIETLSKSRIIYIIGNSFSLLDDNKILSIGESVLSNNREYSNNVSNVVNTVSYNLQEINKEIHEALSVVSYRLSELKPTKRLFITIREATSANDVKAGFELIRSGLVSSISNKVKYKLTPSVSEIYKTLDQGEYIGNLIKEIVTVLKYIDTTPKSSDIVKSRIAMFLNCETLNTMSNAQLMQLRDNVNKMKTKFEELESVTFPAYSTLLNELIVAETNKDSSRVETLKSEVFKKLSTM